MPIVPSLALFGSLLAQQHQHDHMGGGAMSMGNGASQWLMRQSSGTVFQPQSWPMPMAMQHAAGWHLMWMGQAFVVNTQQSGPRGRDATYSANWGMLAAARDLGKGTLMIRAMLSLDPLTVRNRQYPLLFQTGETAYGRPIIDGQHPHELLMEFSVQYARQLGEKTYWNIYYAPVGEPALGPASFPHRASAMEIPQAVLGHHWQDSTHIANNVATAGITYRGKVRLEASGFRGREPDENRWNIDFGAMDSYSGRLTVFPNANWSAQVSMGRLRNPEVQHTGDVVRTTASLHHIRPKPGGNWWAASLVWGRNYKTSEREATHAVLAEAVYPFLGRKNFATARYEWSQRDELFPATHDGHGHAYPVHAWTGGYTRDIGTFFGGMQTGVGANVSTYVIGRELWQAYGEHPWGVQMFLRVRLRTGGQN
ncbi:MAG: hypothetical protein JST65_21900 [Acidobacteria bacterium]|nr:hypothetical protein [Acidobacteriota bacterium]